MHGKTYLQTENPKRDERAAAIRLESPQPAFTELNRLNVNHGRGGVGLRDGRISDQRRREKNDDSWLQPKQR